MSAKKLQPDSGAGVRIKQVRQSLGLTQQAFADTLGIVQGFLSGIERGKKIPSDTLLIALCHLYKISEEWLCTGHGEMKGGGGVSALRPEGGARTGIPLLRTIRPGFPADLKESDVIDFLVFPEAAEDAFGLLCRGNFMAPTIADGDVVIFRPATEFVNGDIVLLNNRWGEVIMRRYRFSGGEVIYSPDNISYAPFKPAPNTTVFGKVVDVWRRVKF